MKDGVKSFINGIINANGEQWCGFTVLAFFLALATTGIVAVNSDRKVRCNYLQMDISSSVTVYRIKNDINWADDTTAFASANQDEVLEVFSTMKQCSVQ